MHVGTLFPAAKRDGEARGGVVLVRIEQPLDRVARRFVTPDGRGCDDEWFRPAEDESSQVAMAPGSAIAWFRGTEFSRPSVWTTVVVDVDKVKADDPRAEAEDHCRLLSGEPVDDGFKFLSWDGVKLCESVVVGVRSQRGIGDGLDRFLIDSGLEERLANNPGIDTAAFDSRDGDLRLC